MSLMRYARCALAFAQLPWRCAAAAVQLFVHTCATAAIGRDRPSTPDAVAATQWAPSVKRLALAAARVGAAARHCGFLEPSRLWRRAPPRQSACKRRTRASRMANIKIVVSRLVHFVDPSDDGLTSQLRQLEALLHGDRVRNAAAVAVTESVGVQTEPVDDPP